MNNTQTPEFDALIQSFIQSASSCSKPQTDVSAQQDKCNVSNKYSAPVTFRPGNPSNICSEPGRSAQGLEPGMFPRENSFTENQINYIECTAKRCGGYSVDNILKEFDKIFEINK